MRHGSLVLTLDSSGAPVRWATWEEAVCYKVKDLIAWCIGDEEDYFGGISRATNNRSKVSVPSIIAVKHLSKHLESRPVLLTNNNLFGRDRRICGYCGERFALRYLTRDHILPISRGGKDDWTNCVTACHKCNCTKGNKLLSETGMSLIYVPYVPSRVEALIVNNSRILADQMEYLRVRLPKNSRVLLN